MNKKLNRPGASLVIANWADLDKNENILTDALDSPRAFKAGISRAVEDAIRRWWKRNRCEKNSCFRIFDLGSGSGSDIDKAIELLLHEIEQNPPVHKDTHIKIDAALIDSCQSVLDSETKKTVTRIKERCKSAKANVQFVPTTSHPLEPTWEAIDLRSWLAKVYELVQNDPSYENRYNLGLSILTLHHLSDTDFAGVMRMVAGILAPDEGRFIYGDIAYPKDHKRREDIWGRIISQIRDNIREPIVRDMWLCHYEEDEPYYRTTDWILHNLCSLHNCKCEALSDEDLPEDKRIYTITRYPLKEQDKDAVYRIQREMESIRASARHAMTENQSNPSDNPKARELVNLLEGLGYTRDGIKWRLESIYGKGTEIDRLNSKQLAEELERLHITRLMAEPPLDPDRADQTPRTAFSLTALRIAGGTFLMSPLEGRSRRLLQQYKFSTPFFACPYNALMPMREPMRKSIHSVSQPSSDSQFVKAVANAQEDLLNELFIAFRTWGVDDAGNELEQPTEDEASKVFKIQEVRSSGENRIAAMAPDEYSPSDQLSSERYLSQIYLVSTEEMCAWLLLWHILVSKGCSGWAEENARRVENRLVKWYTAEIGNGQALDRMSTISELLDNFSADEQLKGLYLYPVTSPLDQLMHVACAAHMLGLSADNIAECLNEARATTIVQSQGIRIVDEFLRPMNRLVSGELGFDDRVSVATGIHAEVNEEAYKRLSQGNGLDLDTLLRFACNVGERLKRMGERSPIDDIHRFAPFPVIAYAYWWHLYHKNDRERGIHRPIHMVSGFGPPSTDRDTNLFDYYFVMGVDSSLADLSPESIAQIVSFQRTLISFVCDPMVRRAEMDRQKEIGEREAELRAAKRAAETARKFGSGIAHNTKKIVDSLPYQDDFDTRKAYVRFVLGQMDALQLVGQREAANRCIWMFVNRLKDDNQPIENTNLGWMRTGPWLKKQFGLVFQLAKDFADRHIRYEDCKDAFDQMNLESVLKVTVPETLTLKFPSDPARASLTAHKAASNGLSLLETIMYELALNALKGCGGAESNRLITASIDVNDSALTISVKNTGSTPPSAPFADHWNKARILDDFRGNRAGPVRGLTILALMADDQDGDFNLDWQHGMYTATFTIPRRSPNNATA